MPDIKWIKINTEMFDDEKIRIIEAMPEADTLIVIWIRLICMAGKVNAGGHIFLAPDFPYDSEQLAAVFNRPLATVRLALATFEHLKMIELSENGTIFLPKFETHQNIEGMEKVRALATARQQKKRAKVKIPETTETRLSVTSRDSHAVDKIRIDKNREDKKLEIWNNVLLKIKSEVNSQNFEAWYKDTVCFDITDKEIVVGVEREDQAANIEKNARALIENIILNVTGKPLKLRMVLIDKGDADS